MLVESYRWEGKVKQRTIRNFGRLDKVEWEKYRQVLARYNTFYFLNPPKIPDGSALRNAHRDEPKPAEPSEPVQAIEPPPVQAPEAEEQYAEYQHVG